MSRNVEVSRDIAASPEAVFAAVSDVTRMGEWSPECHACEWGDGATAPAVGVTFTGHNRHGDDEWTIESKIVECVPGTRFAFDATVGDFAYARWSYDIEATDGGSRVTESWEDKRPQEFIDASAVDRAVHNKAGMEATLTGLAAAVEQ
jgi:uncharacterized protein YndB with AHSA1/START domain